MRHPSRVGMALLPVLALAAGVGLLAGASRPEASAQDDPTEAYRLVDTWDGAMGQSAPGSLFQPAGMDQTAAAVFVVDKGNYRVQRFSPSGAFEAAWGNRGTGAGQFLDPQDVAVDGAALYVTDPGNHRLAVFDSDGGFEANWDVAGDGGPWGVAAADGAVLVTLPSAGEVVVLRDGAEIRRWGGMDEPRGVDVGPDGRVYVADAGSSSIRIFGPDGAPRGTVGTTLAPYDIAVDVTNDLWVLRRDAILWFSAGSRASRLAMFYDGVAGVTVSNRNGVYASVASNLRQRHWVVHYPWRPRVGLPDTEWRILGYPPGRMRAPRAIHAGADGNLWVVDDWPRVQAFAPDGRPVQQHVLPEAPADVAVMPDGELVVGETRRLLRVMPDGTISGNLRLAKGTTRYWLTALAMDDDEEVVRILDGNFLAVRRYGVTDTLRDLDSAFVVGDRPQWQLYWDMAAPRPDPRGRLFVVN
ncbi:MAG: 6-bladed beta-propeller [Anaerolineae bacterium]